jgi:hypothetical protein
MTNLASEMIDARYFDCVCVGKTIDTAKLIATDMPRVLRTEPGKRERDDTL